MYSLSAMSKFIHNVSSFGSLVQDAQVRAGHAVSQLSERLMLEQEDILSHFDRVQFDENHLKSLRKQESEEELTRFST